MEKCCMYVPSPLPTESAKEVSLKKQCARLLNVSLRFLLNNIRSNHWLTTQMFNFQMFGHFTVLIQEGKKVTGTSSGLYEKASTTGDLPEWEHSNTWECSSKCSSKEQGVCGLDLHILVHDHYKLLGSCCMWQSTKCRMLIHICSQLNAAWHCQCFA